MIKKTLYCHWLTPFMIVFASYAWLATPVMLGRSAGINQHSVELGLAILGLTSFFLALYLLQKNRVFQRWMRLAATSTLPSLVTIIFFGVALRILWILAFPAVPSSDGATYIQLALRLINEGYYETAGTKAYWPPGYPFFLIPWLKVFPVAIAVPVSQLCLFVLGAVGCHNLARMFSGDRAGRMAALIFAVWPNLIMLSSNPQKEYVIVALLPWVLLGLYRGTMGTLLLAGLAMGYCTLVQPSLQLLLPIMFICPLLMRQSKSYLKVALLVMTTVAVITPWTLRNIDTFGQFVLISTNGGSNLYRANNPLATGGYTSIGEVDVSGLDELQQDRVSKKLAIEWIVGNPLLFTRLIVEKQVRFMGDDAIGVYATLRTGKGTDSVTTYIGAKLFANLYWLLIWLLIALLFLKNHGKPQVYRFLILPWLYLFLLHSIFESDGRYHVSMIWALCVWLSCALQTSIDDKAK